MKKGFKKFLAMVSVVSLTSGVGALSCAAKENLVANNNLPVCYQLIKDKKLNGDQEGLFDKVKVGGADYLMLKSNLSEEQKKLLDEALKLLNPFVVIEKSKVGNGSGKTGVSGVVVTVVGIVGIGVGAVASYFANKFLSNNQEGNA